MRYFHDLRRLCICERKLNKVYILFPELNSLTSHSIEIVQKVRMLLFTFAEPPVTGLSYCAYSPPSQCQHREEDPRGEHRERLHMSD
jgi:hypothetical protein